MSEKIEIDGSQGEGGGQVLRTSVALAAMQSRPLHIHKIRGRRKRPGLKRQHLTAIRAAAEICNGSLRGDELNGSELHFEPGTAVAGEYHFAVGTAGSACLVFQTVLWPLLFASGNSRVVFEGGTHNPMAPPFDFIERSFLPVLRKMGAKVELTLEAHGFMPAGGGRFVAEIEGDCQLSPIELCALTPVQTRRATALVANLPGTIAIRELRAIREILEWKNEECLPKVVQDSPGPGNAVILEVVREDLSAMVVEFGERNTRAEKVAASAAERMSDYLESGVPVCEHLADQLVIPFALAGAGRFRTGPLSDHTQTNMQVVQRFCDTKIDADEGDDGVTLGFSAA